jgi:hypothetical protein
MAVRWLAQRSVYFHGLETDYCEPIEEYERLLREYLADLKLGGPNRSNAAATELLESERQGLAAELLAKLGENLPVEVQSRLVATAQPASVSSPDTPMGFLGGAALADALGIHATLRGAFFQNLGRKRKSLGDGGWHEVREPRPNSPRFLYRADSQKLRDLAADYQNPKPV